MTGPLPARGSVIRYAYLWADEKKRGREEGRKDRPALVLALSVRQADGDSEVLVLPVTHTPPVDSEEAVLFPEGVKRRIGLDDMPSWIITIEANAFRWPGPDVRAVPGRIPTTMIYGLVPESLLRLVAIS